MPMGIEWPSSNATSFLSSSQLVSDASMDAIELNERHRRQLFPVAVVVEPITLNALKRAPEFVCERACIKCIKCSKKDADLSDVEALREHVGGAVHVDFATNCYDVVDKLFLGWAAANACAIKLN